MSLLIWSKTCLVTSLLGLCFGCRLFQSHYAVEYKVVRSRVLVNAEVAYALKLESVKHFGILVKVPNLSIL